MTNYYSDKPVVPYHKTVVEMARVIASIAAAEVDKEIKRMAYIMFRNESANGQRGINNNYCGFQADSGRWGAIHDAAIEGVVDMFENKTGRRRLFLSFYDVSGCIGMLLERVEGRGLYIGGTTHKILIMAIRDVEDLARAYKKEWAAGSAKAEPSDDEVKNFISMYAQAEKLF